MSLLSDPVTSIKMMKYQIDTMDDENTDMDVAATENTIDPSLIASRIRHSATLQTNTLLNGAEPSQELPHFPKLSALQAAGNRIEYRRIRCPPHRYTPLRECWEQILTPLVEFLKLQVNETTVWSDAVDDFWHETLQT
jgi:hypothetical protein